MTIPALTYPCWSKAASGGLARIKSTNLAMQFLTKNFERSEEPVAQKATHIHAFFSKWERVLGSEIQQLTRI